MLRFRSAHCYALLSGYSKYISLPCLLTKATAERALSYALRRVRYVYANSHNPVLGRLRDGDRASSAGAARDVLLRLLRLLLIWNAPQTLVRSDLQLNKLFIC